MCLVPVKHLRQVRLYMSGVCVSTYLPRQPVVRFRFFSIDFSGFFC